MIRMKLFFISGNYLNTRTCSKIKYLELQKLVKNVLLFIAARVDYTANNACMDVEEIFTDWLTKWDNELRHDIFMF